MPTLQASNSAVVQRPGDRPQGTLVVGGQGSGKTSFLLRSFLNDCRDPNCSPILIDPKSEVARTALALVPPSCDKTVWFLDLAFPRFGMSPLRLPPATMRDPRKLSGAVSGVADNIVNSLLDVNEGQIFQASRDLLYHATIGALALARSTDTRPRFEDVYGLLLPYRADLRDAVVSATAHIPDLDQTHEFWAHEIPDMIEGASSITRQQMKAPRNKVGGIVSVPPLRRFFNHPVDMPLSSIVERRDILIVDAAMGGGADRPGIGEENSIACMRFLLRMLHSHMQHQIHLEPARRARVALHLEECHYLINETIIDMLATHRAAGLDVTLVHQFFAQLLSSASGPRSEKIRKGILNLCQSRCLFRLGDPVDAEEAARIAMPVFESLFRSDPESRARMRATPEALLGLRTWHCLASWIIGGQRAQAFIGRTFAMPSVGLGWTRHHYQRLVDRCGEYPETMSSTYTRSTPADTPGPSARGADEPTAGPDSDSATGESTSPPTPPRRATGAHLQPERWSASEPADDTDVMRSRVLKLVGKPVSERDAKPPAADAPTPETYAELAVIDQIVELQAPTRPRTTAPLQRVAEQHLRVLKLLDRCGMMTAAQLRRAAWPDGIGERAVQKALARLESAGLIRRTPTRLRAQSRRNSPPLWSLTSKGFVLGQEPPGGLPPVIAPRRRYRPSEARDGARVRHDLHVVNWMQSLHQLVPDLVTDNWRTARYYTARFSPPLLGEGRDRRPLRASDIQLPDGYALSGVAQRCEEIVADLAVELRLDAEQAAQAGLDSPIRFDLLLELDLTERPAYNRDKLARYDAFLTGWCLAHPRIARLGTRPIVVFTSPNARSMLALMKEADEVMTASIGRLGTPEHEWYFAGRQHTFFAIEGDVHHRSGNVLGLQRLPAQLRRGLGDQRGPAVRLSLEARSAPDAPTRSAGDRVRQRADGRAPRRDPD
ncbi:replication-relaxation family protein [Conexibacter sp. CPCC 206217]|uniref:replication-relaxation family protein n=1 Tax=Conexibacter sp. CPCC 206217 TaxID=3064574 RepID=UPI00272A2832|nr:replication-relaxation family protein [Conexibacter sp. CPCC 206217]